MAADLKDNRTMALTLRHAPWHSRAVTRAFVTTFVLACASSPQRANRESTAEVPEFAPPKHVCNVQDANIVFSFTSADLVGGAGTWFALLNNDDVVAIRQIPGASTGMLGCYYGTVSRADVARLTQTASGVCQWPVAVGQPEIMDAGFVTIVSALNGKKCEQRARADQLYDTSRMQLPKWKALLNEVRGLEERAKFHHTEAEHNCRPLSPSL
jgi:hypothetical protein